MRWFGVVLDVLFVDIVLCLLFVMLACDVLLCVVGLCCWVVMFVIVCCVGLVLECLC